jgi:hypothetical protein
MRDWIANAIAVTYVWECHRFMAPGLVNGAVPYS